MVCARTEEMARISAPVCKGAGRPTRILVAIARSSAQRKCYASVQRARHQTQQRSRLESISGKEVERARGRSNRPVLAAEATKTGHRSPLTTREANCSGRGGFRAAG